MNAIKKVENVFYLVAIRVVFFPSLPSGGSLNAVNFCDFFFF